MKERLEEYPKTGLACILREGNIALLGTMNPLEGREKSVFPLE